jgi:2-polyprenyl-6-methoxyphenol hydroxylase-like FAD-dependent oxidoreductase
MIHLKPITIVGGGLAGLTLGIGLRRQRIPVTIWEAGHYPRHRVCGEFISGDGQDSLKRLGLWERIVEAGASVARTSAFFSGTKRSRVQLLPQPALCVSRLVLDNMLAQHFEALGGELQQGRKWTNGVVGAGLVRASGRRSQPVENGWRWFGIKVHAKNAPLSADIEMHAVLHGYVGLCRLSDNTVNVCGLFRRGKSEPAQAKSWSQILCDDPFGFLGQRLKDALLEPDSFCSVAGLPLRPQRASAHEECSIGDALTMIPPVTGNGMSMAFESAELAIDPLAGYSCGQITWEAARQAIARACDQQFAHRLLWARWIQSLMFSPGLHRCFGPAMLASQPIWAGLFSRTR